MCRSWLEGDCIPNFDPRGGVSDKLQTAQIIEALNPHHTDSSGLLIANDADHKRTHMLVHQTGRMPSKGLVVTNLDASESLPAIPPMASDYPPTGAIPNISLGDGETLQFDRILADVP